MGFLPHALAASLGAATLGAATLGACAPPGAFACDSDTQCTDGARLGQCEPTGWCSFPDPLCDSGYKYGAHAGGGLAHDCVDPSSSNGSTTDEPGPTPTSSTSLPTSTTTPLDPTDGALDSTTTPEPLTSGPSDDTTSADPSTDDTGPYGDPAVFFDDFERPNSLALGNGWIEKTPTAFQIVDGQVVFESSASGFEDNLWYRDESLLDVEVCVEFRVLATHVDNHPQVHTRMQPDDIEVSGSVTTYLIYIEGTSLRLQRIVGGSFGTGWFAPMSTALQAGGWYRMCIVVVGTDPVELEGTLWQEHASGWSLHTEVFGTDASASRIVLPGATGSSGADAPQFVNWAYDNFRRVNLAP